MVVQDKRILTSSHLNALPHHHHALERGGFYFQLKLKIIRDKCLHISNNIGLAYQNLNMRLVFYFSLKVEQIHKWN
jgi:hypothetical protein